MIPGSRGLISLAMLSVASLACPNAFASEQVYHPNSPTFGGNALNGTFLLSSAQAQGLGVKSGQNSPDLSGLTSALSKLGTGSSVAAPVIVIGSPSIPASP